MIQNESRLEIVDNSGAQEILVIRCLGGSNRKYSGIGDLVVGTVKKAKPNAEIKKKQVVTALIVTTRKSFFRRRDNTWITFSRNCAVLVKVDEKKNYKPIGTRITVPLIWELDSEKFKEIIPLAKLRI